MDIEEVTEEVPERTCLDCGTSLEGEHPARKRCHDCAAKVSHKKQPIVPDEVIEKRQEDKKAAAAKKGPAPKKVSERKAPRSEAAIKGTYAKLLIITTLIMMRVEIRRRNILDMDGNLAEELALTDDEAETFAAPLARITNTNKLASSVMGPIVDNSDLIDAGFALYDYYHRVTRALDMARTEGAGNIRPDRSRTTQAIMSDIREDVVREQEAPNREDSTFGDQRLAGMPTPNFNGQEII